MEILYDFFEISRGGQGVTEFTVQVTPTSGDPDLYITSDGKLPSQRRYGWHATAVGEDAVTVDAHGRTSCAVDATQEPCAADEPALMPWPPDGPGWLVWLTLKLLVWYPVPLLPGSVEMACCDG